MSETNRTTLQVVIEMIASGNGHKVSKENLRELEKEAETINAKVNKSAGDNMRLGNISNILAALKTPEIEAEAVQAGAKVGESVSKGMIDEFQSMNYNIKRHWGAMFGQLAGMPGMGMMVATGGTAAAVGISMLVVEKAVHSLSGAMAKFEERLAATQGLMDRMKETQVFSEENLHKLSSVAEGMSTAEHSTSDWLVALGELTRVGGDPSTMGPMVENVHQLAKLLGGDLTGATKMATDAMQGEFEGLKEVGIVVDSTLSQQQAMTFVTQQLALRMSEFGNAAVSAAPKVLEIKEAAKKVAGELLAMKTAADDAQDALKRLMEVSDAGKSEKQKQIDADEKRDVQAVETAFAEKKIKTRADADAKIQAIQKNAAAARLGVDKETYETQRKAQVAAFTDANEGIGQRAGAIAQQQQRVAAADALERAAGNRVRIEEEIDRLEAEAQGKGGGVEPGQGRIEEIRKATKQLQDQLAVAMDQLSEARKGMPEGVTSRAAEQKRLEDMRKGFAPMDEAAVKHMLQIQDAIKDLERKYEGAKKLTTTEAGTKDLATQQKTATAEEQQRKQLESEAKNYVRRMEDAAKRGLPAPDVPESLRGKNFEFDQHNNRFKWLNQNEGGPGNDIREATKALVDVGQAAMEMKQVAQAIASRMRDDGSRVG